MSRIRTCISCNNPFFGRRDAKTCSVRCRKALQRMRDAADTSGSSKSSMRKSGYTRHVPTGTSSSSRTSTARRLRNLVLLMIFGAVILAANLSGGVMAAVSQGYVSNDTELRQYMAVRVAGDDSKGHTVVQTSSIAQEDKTIGIAVGVSDSLLTVSPASSEVYVVSSGPSKVYISDINGAVKRGDLLAVSPLRGILMKSTDPTKPTVGQALEDFISKSTQTTIAKDVNDKPVEVHVALMQMDIAIKPPRLSGSQSQDSWLKSLGNSLVGHEISTPRIVSAMAIFFTLLIIEGELIYGTIASTITAIGRNPLARKSIVAQSLRSVRMAIIILIMGGLAVGLLLWL